MDESRQIRNDLERSGCRRIAIAKDRYCGLCRTDFRVDSASDRFCAGHGCAAAGYSFPAAAQLANLAAGIEVSRVGADVISREDLSRAFCSRKEALEREPSVDMAGDRTANEHVLKP
jgi:bifunctional ADP-heptose synthase (sugar kinase/adenylyltransferase)